MYFVLPVLAVSVTEMILTFDLREKLNNKQNQVTMATNKQDRERKKKDSKVSWEHNEKVGYCEWLPG